MHRVTFDDLVIGAQLPDQWRVLGSAASVQVAPFPDPFDRSLQVINSGDGGPSIACYEIGAAKSISLDVFSAAPAGMVASLGDPEMGDELALAVGADGSIVLQPNNSRLGSGVVDPEEWYQVSFVIDTVAGTVTLQVESREAIGFAGVETSVPFDWQSVAGPEELCVAGPSRAGEAAFVDNVTIE